MKNKPTAGEEKECAHTFVSNGQSVKNTYAYENRSYYKTGECVVATVYCTKCGKIKY